MFCAVLHNARLVAVRTNVALKCIIHEYACNISMCRMTFLLYNRCGAMFGFMLGRANVALLHIGPP